MAEVIVFTKPNCVQCEATKRAMKKHNIAHTTVDISQDDDALSKVKQLGHYQAPVVVVGDDSWSGFRPDRIKTLIRA